jgi:hypothetical protein
MSDHEDVLRQMSLRLRSSSRIWADANGNADSEIAAGKADAIDATLAELAALRAEVGILSAAKAGARYIAERDTLRQRLADIEAGHGMRARLAEVEREREALISSRNNVEEELRRAGLSEVGPPFLRVSKLRQRAERAETALRDTRCCLHVQGHWDCAVTHARARAALAPVAEPAKCSRCDGSGEVQCGPPSDGPIPCPKCAPVAEQPEQPQERIEVAAIRRTVMGRNHAECFSKLARPPAGATEQGFISTHARFVDRIEALRIATAAGQLAGRTKHRPLDRLMSEDLWDVTAPEPQPAKASTEPADHV